MTDEPRWPEIRTSTAAMSFDTYARAVDDAADLSLQGLRSTTERFVTAASAPEKPWLSVELIWSYWLEEGRLSETMKAISKRFQNRRRAGHDPLAELKIDFLRPLGRLIWAYIQDEPHRLTATRRAYEYEHQYGLRVSGQGKPLRPVERRSQFPAALDDLLRKAGRFYARADKAPTPDASPVLKALRKMHRLLSEGAHNQFGELPWTARQEMLMEQWLLARPEFDDYLPSASVFPEPWMSRVEAMRRLQGWGKASIQHYVDLATCGEQLLLSIRLGNWPTADADAAANWARFWRQEVERYVAAHRAVTAYDG